MARVSLTPEEHALVLAAVERAEAGTDGEIVTIVTDRSDAYHDAALHHAVLATLAVPALVAAFPEGTTRLLDRVHGGWDAPPVWLFPAAILLVQIVVFLLARYALAYAPLRLALTPRITKARRVRRRAIQYFQVGAERRTAAREGILLYLSRAERMAEIVADSAVHAAVPAERWGEAMAALVDEVRAGRPGAGMAAAIERIGVILAEHFPKTADDRNELPDRLIEL